LPFEELRDQMVDSVLCARIVDSEEIRMIDRAQEARFVFGAIEPVGVTSKCGRKNLDRNRTIKPGVAGAIPLAHPTRAQGREDFVGAESDTSGYSHGSAAIIAPENEESVPHRTGKR
jgi:hypothetical protein